jgi:hypothetical protein
MVYKKDLFFDPGKDPKNDLFLSLENQRLFCPIVILAHQKHHRRKYSFVVMFRNL